MGLIPSPRERRDRRFARRIKCLPGFTGTEPPCAVLLCMGLFSSFLFDAPSRGRKSTMSISIPRCSEIIVVAALEDPSQFLLSPTAGRATCFSPRADVLTFLRLPL
jgi:hypothetical protein